MIESSKGLPFKGLHKREDINSQKDPAASRDFHWVAVRKILTLLLTLNCGNIYPRLHRLHEHLLLILEVNIVDLILLDFVELMHIVEDWTLLIQ